ncbi:MAG: hypothetical protein IJT16_05550 [Lachnospiraceae bacterium]|nr:hypothetical protein [Lachnospiraceae bacterium]
MITVLCGANAYEQKYYFNEDFNGLPAAIKDELHIICVLFTEEIGGIFTISFDEKGEVFLSTNADEEDILYDEIGSALMIKEVQRKRRKLFESLETFYKVFVLHDTSVLLEEED